MPTIEFLRTKHRMEWPEGGRLLDLCDRDVRAGIPFACRDANCGTCRIEVQEGIELCEPPEQDELDMLQELNATDPKIRLGCQLVIRAGDGRVKLWVTL